MERTGIIEHNNEMVQDPLLDTANCFVDSLTIERASFRRRLLLWREGERRFTTRYSWNKKGLMVSREKMNETRLYAYNEAGRRVACYHLDASGTVTRREITEWDGQSRRVQCIVTTVDPATTETWTYEYDDAGRMVAEKRGHQVRVEKYDRNGRLEQEYLYDGEKRDLVTDYTYGNDGRLEVISIRDPDGSLHRKTEITRDEDGRVISETIQDATGRTIKDESFIYGGCHGNHWLERVTWIPNGRRRERRRPREVVYRSFTYSGIDTRDAVLQGSRGFANGVYHGSLVNDQPEGSGVFQYNDGSRYEGEFHGGVMNGGGRFTWPDGRVMEGTFCNGVLEGKGECSWTDGSRYTGLFHDGLMHGPGLFVWSNGTRFEGLFEKGRRTDQGVWEYPGDNH